jgi:hypothetical protein
MGRRLRIALLAVAIVAVVAVALWLLVRSLFPATRFIYGLASIGADEAVLLTRRNEDSATSRPGRSRESMARSWRPT